ncbi:glycosyltransferase [Sulfitobacter sp. 1A12057]|uniref:glycosyltransferase n=1 Tax=Sulfitobacter sp. 1A12057 TaxID=3368567 RepID=UPI0037456FAA
MTRVFVNGISAKSGGGRSILTNFLKVARSRDDAFSYVVAVPAMDGYADLANERVSLVPMGRQSSNVLVPLASVGTLPQLIRRARCDLLFNLSDIPVATRVRQVFLFDWPYAAFPQSRAWQLSTAKDRVVRNAKLFFFKRLLPYVDVMIAQNDVLAEQLRLNYGLRDIHVIPNSVSVDNLGGGVERNFELGDGFKFLCLSRYYSHKNLELFVPLAEKFKAAGLKVKIVITISPEDGPGAKALLSEISNRRLSEIIINLGTVSMDHVPSLYKQTDALLLPTLLESFSGTYVEAMYHRRPIFTSDLPFAKGVCGSAAFYFDPDDAGATFDCLQAALEHPEKMSAKADAAARLRDTMPTWEDAYDAYSQAFLTSIRSGE